MKLTYDEGVILIKKCWIDNGHVINVGKMAAINSLRRNLCKTIFPIVMMKPCIGST